MKLGAVAEEDFLHNHQECVKAQAKGVEVGYFLKSVGPSNGIVWVIRLSSEKSSRVTKHQEMIEMLFEDQEVLQCRLPVCRSPQSPRAPVKELG
ncbi:hypothetical protein CASFOL_006858 [Castilleja foliolosa]|uniref:Uncharacterized protein n=1 Tax=Castilleja foliolosa TaxID=1961234 RepID=A0ABD3EBH0_9LAMI